MVVLPKNYVKTIPLCTPLAGNIFHPGAPGAKHHRGFSTHRLASASDLSGRYTDPGPAYYFDHAELAKSSHHYQLDQQLGIDEHGIDLLEQ